MLATYVDKIHNAGVEKFVTMTEQVQKRLEVKPYVYEDFHFLTLISDIMTMEKFKSMKRHMSIG